MQMSLIQSSKQHEWKLEFPSWKQKIHVYREGKKTKETEKKKTNLKIFVMSLKIYSRQYFLRSRFYFV